MAARLGSWLDERLGWRRVWEAIFLRKVPKVNWLYTLGSATLFVAVNQIVTGILLTIYYVPTPDQAYESVQLHHHPGAGRLVDPRPAPLGGQRHGGAGRAAHAAGDPARRLQVSPARSPG